MSESLSSLIMSGKLPRGTKLHHQGRQYAERTVTATVAEDGIRLHDRTYLSPSGAAQAITGHPVNGWLFWKLPSGEPLGTLRADVTPKGDE